jgi:fructose/tagatose bisphosphate aldolase
LKYSQLRYILKQLRSHRGLSEKAHAKGISVECEVGSIGGEEDGIIGTGELADMYIRTDSFSNCL